MKPGTSISTYTTDHSHMETNVESVYNNGRTYQLIFHDVGDGVIAMTITGNGKTSSSVSCTQAIYSYPPKKHLFLLKTLVARCVYCNCVVHSIYKLCEGNGYMTVYWKETK